MTNPSQSEGSILVYGWIFKLPNSFQRSVSSKFPRRHQSVAPCLVWARSGTQCVSLMSQVLMSPSAWLPVTQVPPIQPNKDLA